MTMRTQRIRQLSRAAAGGEIRWGLIDDDQRMISPFPPERAAVALAVARRDRILAHK
jgi:hypothetical protein